MRASPLEIKIIRAIQTLTAKGWKYNRRDPKLANLVGANSGLIYSKLYKFFKKNGLDKIGQAQFIGNITQYDFSRWGPHRAAHACKEDSGIRWRNDGRGWEARISLNGKWKSILITQDRAAAEKARKQALIDYRKNVEPPR